MCIWQIALFLKNETSVESIDNDFFKKMPIEQGKSTEVSVEII